MVQMFCQLLGSSKKNTTDNLVDSDQHRNAEYLPVVALILYRFLSEKPFIVTLPEMGTTGTDQTVDTSAQSWFHRGSKISLRGITQEEVREPKRLSISSEAGLGGAEIRTSDWIRLGRQC